MIDRVEIGSIPLKSSWKDEPEKLVLSIFENEICLDHQRYEAPSGFFNGGWRSDRTVYVTVNNS